MPDDDITVGIDDLSGGAVCLSNANDALLHVINDLYKNML